MKPFLIFGGIVIVLAGAAYLLFVYLPSKNTPKEGDSCKTAGGKDGKITNGTCVESPGAGTNGTTPPVIPPVIPPNQIPVTALGKGSTLISASSASKGDLSIFGYGIKESNINSYNIFTSPGSNPKAVHYEVAFNVSCHNYLWYKGWLYSYRGAVQDATTGKKTCYYGIDKSKLPNELLVQTPANGQCSNFKLYLSGIEYKYDGIRLIGIDPQIGNVNFCVYKKQ